MRCFTVLVTNRNRKARDTGGPESPLLFAVKAFGVLRLDP
jgi:hypothetical protein